MTGCMLNTDQEESEIVSELPTTGMTEIFLECVVTQTAFVVQKTRSPMHGFMATGGRQALSAFCWCFWKIPSYYIKLINHIL